MHHMANTIVLNVMHHIYICIYRPLFKKTKTQDFFFLFSKGAIQRLYMINIKPKKYIFTDSCNI